LISEFLKRYSHHFTARGTSETGAYGSIVGGPLVAAVKKVVPGATGFDVKYPADMSAASPDKGAEAVVAYFQTQAAKCPSQKYVIVGYSQGCVVQRRAMLKVDEATQNRIIAAVTFGDPGEFIPLQNDEIERQKGA
jgi:hypothetical protein